MSKLIPTLILFLFVSYTAFSQDIIVKKDGSIIKSKVIELNSTEIKYKKISNIDGPTYVLEKSEILSINYENGEVETFSVSNSNKNNQVEQQVKVASDNQSLISAYNKPIQTTSKLKNSIGWCWCVLQYAFTDNSVLSNEEIEVIYARGTNHDAGTGEFTDDGDCSIRIKNKTDDVIYVNLGASYYIHVSDKEYPRKYFYDGSRSSVINKGVNNGIQGHIGNLSLGNSSHTSSSTIYHSEEIVKIPPHSIAVLCETKIYYVHVQYYIWQPPTQKETLSIGLPLENYPKCTVRQGEAIDYSIANTPVKYNIKIVYSKDQTFSNFSQVENTLYLSRIVGSRYSTEATLYDKSLTRDGYYKFCK